jgi:predicted DCC family thiol-disulfide oxidoreductase YuxK
MPQHTAPPILFYDGVCGYCNWIVRLIARADTHEEIKFAPLQSSLAEALLERHPELRQVDTAIMLEKSADGAEKLSTKWQLTRAVLPHTSGLWRLGCAILAAIPLPLGNLIYDVIAKYRYRIFGRYETCKIPDATIRRRLADFPE